MLLAFLNTHVRWNDKRAHEVVEQQQHHVLRYEMIMFKVVPNSTLNVPSLPYLIGSVYLHEYEKFLTQGLTMRHQGYFSSICGQIRRQAVSCAMSSLKDRGQTNLEVLACRRRLRLLFPIKWWVHIVHVADDTQQPLTNGHRGRLQQLCSNFSRLEGVIWKDRVWEELGMDCRFGPPQLFSEVVGLLAEKMWSSNDSSAWMNAYRTFGFGYSSFRWANLFGINRVSYFFLGLHGCLSCLDKFEIVSLGRKSCLSGLSHLFFMQCTNSTRICQDDECGAFFMLFSPYLVPTWIWTDSGKLRLIGYGLLVK